MSFLHRYDAEYYLAWVRRTVSFASELQRCYPWLTIFSGHHNQIVDLLLDLPVTIIHGEYYKPNILYLLGTAYPVDWESAAIAPGEIDLASLTERWPEEIAEHCTAAYHEARWPEGGPQDWERRLDAARLYLQLRWLGERPEWTIDEAYQWRFVELHEVSERLGFI
jgi:aminoglycoside/choline kinase family phosphotransferase